MNTSEINFNYFAFGKLIDCLKFELTFELTNLYNIKVLKKYQ
jgi:hypothetical protein